MTYLRRAMPLALTIVALAPTMAHAAVSCPTQQTLTAWAGSPKTLMLTPGCSSLTGPIQYSIVTNGSKGTATPPDATGKFIFTGIFVPTGTDPTGTDLVRIKADDGAFPTVTFEVPITIAQAPLLGTIFDSPTLEQDPPLMDGTPTFDVLYRDLTTLTSTLTDGPVTPLAGFVVQHRGVPGAPKLVRTNAAGTVKLPFRPRVTDLVLLDVPSLPGVFATGAVLFVAPDWNVPKRLPIRHRKFVITGHLLAEKFARTRGTLSFQRKQGTRWVTVARKVKLSASLKFTVTLSTKYSGKRARLVYKPKSVDYITSTFTFTPKQKHVAGRLAASGVRAMHR